MSLSQQHRIDDVHKALRWMMKELSDDPFDALEVDGDKAPYNELNLTTWEELTERGWVKDHGLKRYQFTGEGWRAGVHLLKLTEDPDFAGKMSQLSKTLKGYVTPRPEVNAMVDIFRVRTDSGLDHGFIYNALRTGLLNDVYRMKGAYMDPSDKNHHTIIIPKAYGHCPLPI